MATTRVCTQGERVQDVCGGRGVAVVASTVLVAVPVTVAVVARLVALVLAVGTMVVTVR